MLLSSPCLEIKAKGAGVACEEHVHPREARPLLRLGGGRDSVAAGGGASERWHVPWDLRSFHPTASSNVDAPDCS